MDTKAILNKVQSGELSPDEALRLLKAQPFEDLGYAKIDHHRAVRQGAGEVIYGEGKTAEQIVGICRHLSAAGAANILITRLDPEKAAAVCHCVAADYDPVSRIARGRAPGDRARGLHRRGHRRNQRHARGRGGRPDGRGAG